MLLTCGDALIDFVPVKTADGRDGYVPVVGGSCLNIAVAMSRLGAPTGFVGGISTDMFGTMIADHLAASKVSLEYVRRSADQTTQAFVRFVNNEPHYAFYDTATAATLWTFVPGSIPFGSVSAVHVGSTTLIDDRAGREALAFVTAARPTTTVSFDPNCRPTLIADKAGYVARMEAFAAVADIVRMSDMDFDYMFGGNAFDAKAESYLAAGAGLVIVTRGGDGVVAWHPKAGRIEVVAPKIELVDTIGAGDTFQGSFLVALEERGLIARDRLAGASREALAEALAFGTRCAAITCSRAGANPPWRAELA
jgi:fructokinase